MIIPDLEPFVLETRRRNRVENQPRLQLRPELAALRRGLHEANYGGIRFRRNVDCYNCFGLAFANRRTAIEDDSEIMKIFNDDGYKRVDKEQLMPGDLVIYGQWPGRLDHVAVVLHRGLDPDAIDTLSAWGQDGEYTHPIGTVPPNLGTPWEYWTERG